MANEPPSLGSERLAALARAAAEAERARSPQQPGIQSAIAAARSGLDADAREALLRDATRIAALDGARPGAAAGAAPATTPAAPPASQDAARARASLELKLQEEATRRNELETSLRKDRENLKQAEETLGLQQRKLKELQEERGKLLTEYGKLENQLRLKVNETEQLQLAIDKLKSSRQSLGDQATAQTEQLTALKTENERLKQEVESARKERDARVATAQTAVEAASAETADAAFRELWIALGKELPEVFAETHVPTRRTFEQLGNALVEFAWSFKVLEQNVHQMLRDLRRVGDPTDKLSTFFTMLTKQSPGLLDALREHLTSGRQRGHFSRLLFALQAWSQAFTGGLYKAVVTSPELVREELNYNRWPTKGSFTVSEEAATGKYFRENVYKQAPDKLGTELRKRAADLAYEDYNTIMKSARPTAGGKPSAG